MAKAIHVHWSKEDKSSTVYLKNKAYFFQVPQDLESRIGKRMLVLGDKKQALYAKELITDNVDEDMYTVSIKTLVPHVSFTALKKKKTLNKKPTRISDNTVFKGLVLELEDWM